MKIFVFEYASALASESKLVTSSVFCEGFAMLKSLVVDLLRAGHEVSTVLSPSIQRFKPLKNINPLYMELRDDTLVDEIREFIGEFEAHYILAPETNGLLEKLVSMFQDSGFSLNCLPEAIKKVRNKISLYNELEKRKVRVPDTRLIGQPVDGNELKKVARDLGFPLIIKPTGGVGCSGLHIVRKPEQLDYMFRKLKGVEYGEGVIVQKLVKGLNTSVSLIRNGSKTLCLSLNSQIVRLRGPEGTSSYIGGFTPLQVELKEDAFQVASRAVKLFEGLRGYVGVDLILTKEGPVVMEINPRLTTSYAAVREVVKVNIAQLILNSVLHGKLPSNVSAEGCSLIYKLEIPRNLSYVFLEENKETMVSPPVPLFKGEEICFSMVSYRGGEVTEVMRNLLEIKRKVLRRFHWRR